MKLGRYKNDTKWNYGISFHRKSILYLGGSEMSIWCFKQNEVTPEGGRVRVDKGFRWALNWSSEIFNSNNRYF